MNSDRFPPRLARAYRQTRYTADGLTVRLGRRSSAADRLLIQLGSRQGGFVAAANPLSRRMPDGWNERRHRALQQTTRRLRSVAGHGIGQGWSEPHLLIAADPRRLVVLARRFRQRAIVVVRQGRPARLLVLCQHARP